MPVPQADEVLVKVNAASVNPVDYKTRSGKSAVKQNQLPMVLGRDVAGIVEQCGSAATHFKKGSEVYALLDREHGGYAEYVIVKERDLATKPAQLDFIQAAAVPMAAVTAWQGLFDHGNLKAGQHVLIHGGAGGVGHLAVQCAKARGARVSTTASKQDLEFVRSLGADQVIDKAEEFEDSVRDVDLVFDLVNGETQDRSWAVLKQGGTMVSTLTKPSAERAKARGARAEHYMGATGCCRAGRDRCAHRFWQSAPTRRCRVPADRCRRGPAAARNQAQPRQDRAAHRKLTTPKPTGTACGSDQLDRPCKPVCRKRARTIATVVY
jgi:NADPH:quinone reductase-like Zn-dependent oxidoreductase